LIIITINKLLTMAEENKEITEDIVTGTNV